MINTAFDGLEELYHHAKFEEDRATRAGYRCENVVFLSRYDSGARWRHNFRENAIKNYEKSKIGGKVCAYHFV